MEAAPPETGYSGRIAGFWVRVLSDLIDALVLGVGGWLLSLPLRGVFEGLGERGVFIGLALSLAYAGILQSGIGGGQTVGKRLLNLRVVKLDGSFLTLDRSLIRYALVAYPIYQTEVTYALLTVFPFLRLEWLTAVQGWLALTLLVGCFLVIPFHPLKRGLHDLVTGTIVTRQGAVDPVFITARTDVRRDKRIVLGVFVLAGLATVASLVIAARFRFGDPVPATTRTAGELGVTNVSIQDLTQISGDRAVHSLVVSGFLPRGDSPRGPDWDTASQRLFEGLHQDRPTADFDAAVIVLRTGYNIGVASSYETITRRVNWKTGAVLGGGTVSNSHLGGCRAQEVNSQ